jgi:hypothetical protein
MGNPFDILLQKNDAGSSDAPVMMVTKSGRFTIGEARRPNITHDNGFLDRYPKREPTADDRKKFAYWLAMLEGAEALCTAQTGSMIGPCGGDLVDANAAYRHFLFGNGKDRHLDYERFVQEDPIGRTLMERLVSDFKYHATVLSKDRAFVKITSEPYYVGGEEGIVGYPETANWQKALGAHVLWVSGNIAVSVSKEHKLLYDAEVVVHAEDRYNFNPGNADVKTGIKDEENGQLELSGLGRQYTNYGELRRQVNWREGEGSAISKEGSAERKRMPSDNRRIRNRL